MERWQEQVQAHERRYRCFGSTAPYFLGFSIMSPSMRPTSSDTSTTGAMSFAVMIQPNLRFGVLTIAVRHFRHEM